MAQKKFGTFAGVFTPSILTILGVIMYLRLGWVVGQAGLIGTIVIIVIAHIISISTGLSVSSISTDKKVKAGGIYYILSRSLGLPIGGAIGLALFVGMGFSVSLYVIGFCESFNPIIGQGTGINDMRLVGTIVLLVVALIAYISTSFALKTQFFILAAVALSVISIFLGTHEFEPEKIVLFASKGSIPMEAVFAVFFPAVTGFTAGVAMSGDLRDPKKSIPIGTMLAIGLGFLIYVSLAVFLAFFVGSDVLKNDTSILLKIAFFSPLVIAGIWGATLSSALGSILGAPRLLQALSNDRIMPGFIGKGSGKDNEPRIALLFTFALAEVGILIGELDVIAGLVSMFFLTAYGFINLACTLENWASSDFRPSFKIPKIISMIGFIAAFAVMFKLDMVSMIASFFVMGGIFLILTRREIKVSSGNVWDGVWSSIVSKGLNKLVQSSTEERNWRPNILLFSGGTEKRPHLVEFGLSLIGKLGLITNFDLIENKSSKTLFSKQEQLILNQSIDSESFFARKHECRDVYEGIESITSIYGFSGMEPNTVLMGWARNSENPLRFNSLLKTINDLDYNLLLLDYDSKLGFGNRSSIDIWLDKPGNYSSMAIAIIRFLLNSEAWSGAKIRLIATTYDGSKTDIIYKDLLRILDENRIQGEVKVINQSIDQKELHDIILIESSETDLIILGLPSAKFVKNEIYIKNINELCEKLGTILLINASTYFKVLPIDNIFKPKSVIKQSLKGVEELELEKSDLQGIRLPENSILANTVEGFYEVLEKTIENLFRNHIINIFESQKKLIDDTASIILNNFNKILKSSQKESTHKILNSLRSAKTSFLFQTNKLFSQYLNESLANQKELFINSFEFLINSLEEIKKGTPEYLSIDISKSKFKRNSGDNRHLKKMKFVKRLLSIFSKNDITIRIDNGIISEYFLHKIKHSLFRDFLSEFGIESYKDTFAFQQMIKTILNGFLKIEKSIGNQNFSPEIIQSEIDDLIYQIEELSSKINNNYKKYSDTFQEALRNYIQEYSSVIERLDVNRIIYKKYKLSKKVLKKDSTIGELPLLWYRNIRMISDIAKIEIIILYFSNRLNVIFTKALSNYIQIIDESLTRNLDTFLTDLERIDTDVADIQNYEQQLSIKDIGELNFPSLINNSLKEIRSGISSIPESLEVVTDESLNSIENNQYGDVEVLTISLQRLVKYFVDTELMGPLNEYIVEIEHSLRQIRDKLQNQIRLINFHNLQQMNSSEIETEDYGSLYKSMIDSSKELIAAEKIKIIEIKTQLQSFIYARTDKVIEKLNPNMIIRSSGSLKQYMIKQETKKAFSKIDALNKKLMLKINSSFVRLWFRKSEALIYANRIQESEKYVSAINQFQNFADILTPDRNVFSKLPFFYRQLFTGKQIITNDFWVGRNHELKIALDAYNKYVSGKSGALMIIGASNSGKSTFSSFVADKISTNKEIYNINPPDGGSIETESIVKQFSKSLNSFGDLDELLQGIPEKSVFILNDIELWWERSENGFAALDTMMKIISQYGNKFFFILNMNIYSYNFINKIKLIENNFLSIVRLGPLNAKELSDIILLRHQSSRINFIYKNKNQEKMTKLQYAKLFNKYFEHSKGNPGAAIHSWISNILKVKENGEILIRPPRKPDFDIFDNIKPIWKIILIQFVLHKRLSVDKLNRIFDNYEFEEIGNNISELLQADFLVKNQNNIFKINPYLQTHIEYKLKSMELI